MSRAQPLVSENPTTDDLCLKLGSGSELLFMKVQVHLFGLCLATIVCGIDVKGTAFGLFSSSNW